MVKGHLISQAFIERILHCRGKGILHLQTLSLSSKQNTNGVPKKSSSCLCLCLFVFNSFKFIFRQSGQLPGPSCISLSPCLCLCLCLCFFVFNSFKSIFRRVDSYLDQAVFVFVLVLVLVYVFVIVIVFFQIYS